MPDASEVFALVPTRYGIVVAAVGDIAARLDAGEDLEDAASNASIDSVNDWDLAGHMERVKQLNLTGDGKAYWASAP